MNIEVTIMVRVDQSENSSHGHSIRRTYDFQDNARFMPAGTADAVQQTAEEMAGALFSEVNGDEALSFTSMKPRVRS
jgi:hypothetical protein